MPKIPVEAFREFFARWRERSEDFLRSLFDLEFTRLLTPRMLPTIYLFAMLASGWVVIAFAIEGFTRSMPLGLLRLLVIGPVAFLILVTLCRIALELCLAVFRIAVHVSEMAGHTEEIAGGLPRIQFWKSLRKKPETRE